MNMRTLLLLLGLLPIACERAGVAEPAAAPAPVVATEQSPARDFSAENAPMKITDEEWKKRLTPEQYRVLREQGTERAFANKYFNHKADGSYTCAGCGHELFDSKTKFDSGTGWPSFYAPADAKAVGERQEDDAWRRIEVVCSNCGGHLGHVFDDGPRPTGQRYCINSAALSFVPRDKPAQK